jgi:thiamine biosynthesis lipoprotein
MSLRLVCTLMIGLVAYLGGAAAHAEWVTRVTDGIMGTRITVELWSDDDANAQAAIEALLAEMRHIDDSMSTYKPTSEVSLVNAKAADAPVPISKELFDLLVTAKDYSRLTDGAFDITYASVGYLYDFRKRVRPSEAQIDKALPAINYEHVLLDPEHQTVRFSQKGVRIDLGGIAKGYAVDRGIDVLKSFGITRAYVSAGGDSRIIGDRFGKPWIVGIRDPRKGPGEVLLRIPLVNAAISTSGDYERFFDENGVRYHHIIDPHTGHSASKVRSATVIGPYATRTDGLSKTAFVLGPEKALEIYNRIDDVDALIVKLDGTVVYSKGMRHAAPAAEQAAAPGVAPQPPPDAMVPTPAATPAASAAPQGTPAGTAAGAPAGGPTGAPVPATTPRP